MYISLRDRTSLTDGWNSDDAIVDYILFLATDDTDAQRLWAEPTPEEAATITAAAFASTAVDRLSWGAETLTRGDANTRRR